MFRTTQVPTRRLSGLRIRGFHALRPSFPGRSAGLPAGFVVGPTTPGGALPRPRFGLLRVRSPLLAQSLLFSLPPGTEMFQFPGFAPEQCPVPRSPAAGCPIRKSATQRVFAPRRGLSQLVTSFFASESLGILHVPFSPFLSFSPSNSFRLIVVDSILRLLLDRSFLDSIYSFVCTIMSMSSFSVVPGRVELPTSTLSV